MKRVTIWILMLALVWVTACEASPSGDELTRMLDAQDRATEAARQLQKAAAQATTKADATREAIALIGQSTRVAQNAQSTATVFAQNAQATQTGRAVDATRAADQARATAFMQNAYATSTVIAAQYTATAFTQNLSATATGQALSAAATATVQAASARATTESASATATSNAQSALATRTSGNATATVIAAGVLVEEEKADWNRKLESGRAVASFIVGGLALIGLVILIGFAVLRFVDAGVLRARVLRDKTGTVFVIGEKDKEGRYPVLVPGRSPGAVLNITPPNIEPLQIEAAAVDAETTKRDQAVSLMLAANTGKGSGEELMDDLVEGEQIRVVDEPPEQLVSGDVRRLLDGHWKERGEHDRS